MKLFPAEYKFGEHVRLSIELFILTLVILSSFVLFTINGLDVKRQAEEAKKDLIEFKSTHNNEVAKARKARVKLRNLAAKYGELEEQGDLPHLDAYVDWILSKSSKCPRELARRIVVFVHHNCKYPKLVLGIVTAESAFDVTAYRSDTKVYGLGQIQYKSWVKILPDFDVDAPRELFDWKKNLLVIDYIINHYYEDNNRSLDKALLNYVGAASNNAKSEKRGSYYFPILQNIGSLTLLQEEATQQIRSGEPKSTPIE